MTKDEATTLGKEIENEYRFNAHVINVGTKSRQVWQVWVQDEYTRQDFLTMQKRTVTVSVPDAAHWPNARAYFLTYPAEVTFDRWQAQTTVVV